MSAIQHTAVTSRNRLRSRAYERFVRHKLALTGVFILLVLASACVFGPYLLPYDMLHIDLLKRFAPPLTGEHYLGTDPMGRDVAARLLMAGRVSLTVGVVSMVLSTFFGVIIGILAGYFGGWLDSVLMRTTDAFLSFPQLFLLLALSAFLEPSAGMITVLIAVTGWMVVARIVAAEIKSLSPRDFVTAAQLSNASHTWVMFRELLPNAAGPIIVASTLSVARAILMEAYISFLGFGIQPPLPSWGNMLNNAQQYLDTAPWLAIVPGVAIILAVSSFNFIGDGLRDALDARGSN